MKMVNSIRRWYRWHREDAETLRYVNRLIDSYLFAHYDSKEALKRKRNGDYDIQECRRLGLGDRRALKNINGQEMCVYVGNR